MLKKLTEYWERQSIKRDRLRIQQHFCKQMVLLLMCGLTPADALNQTVILTTPAHWHKLLSLVNRHVKSGKTLADALSLYSYCFDPLLITLTHSGEQGNRLEANLSLWVKWFDWKQHWTNRFKRALTYPCLMLVLVTAALCTAALLVLPTVLAITPSPPLILTALASLQSTSGFWWLLGVVSIILISYTYRQCILKGMLNTLYYLPLIQRPLTYWQLAHFFYLINTLSSSHIRFDLQLQMACTMLRQRPLQAQWQGIRQRLLNGEPMRQIMNQKDIPPIIQHLLSALNSQHNQDLIWSQLARYFEQHIEWIIQKIEPLIEPAITLITGALVLAFIAIFLLPLYQ